MAEASGSSSGKAFYLCLFIFLCELLVVAAYPYITEKGFYTVIEDEEAQYVRFLGREVTDTARRKGDQIYDVAIVSSKIEGSAYSLVAGSGKDGIGEERLEAVFFGPSMMDSIFDYLLLVSYRFGFIVLCTSFVGVFVLTLFTHALIDRHRRRYAFGDSAIVINAYARTLAVSSVFVGFVLISLPIPLHPSAILLLIAGCTLSLSLLMFALPKKT